MTTFSFETECVRGRVLLVEDASVFREMQSLLLRRAGYHVVTCDLPHLALHELSQQPFDVALLNSDASGIDSAEFFAALRSHQPRIAIIYVAAALTIELAREITHAGAVAVLQRPVNPALLMEKIDFALGHAVRPGAPQYFATAPAPTVSSARGTSTTGTTLDANSTKSTPPFSVDSTAPFPAPNSNPPFRTYDSASPFRSQSVSPFSTQSASPFGSGPGTALKTATVR